MQQLDSCNICGHDQFRVWGCGFERPGLHHVIVKCSRCGLYFANPMATLEEMKRFYGSEYYYGDHEELRPDTIRMRVEHGRDVVLPHLARLTGKTSGSFLEIGCGAGPIVRAAQDFGFNAIGLELSDSAVRTAREILGADVRPHAVEEAGFAEESFDIVYSWHVIEHVIDLARFSRTVHRILKPGGVFVFGTENYDSLPRRYTRALHWLSRSVPGLDTASEHTFLLSSNLVRTAFPRLGFEVQSLRVYQDRPEKFFAPARATPHPLKRYAKYGVLGSIYGICQVFPVGGKMEVVLRKGGTGPPRGGAPAPSGPGSAVER